VKTQFPILATVFSVVLFGIGCASTPKGPPVEGAVNWNGHWYGFISDLTTWTEAKERCEKLGGHLVIINSKEENDFLYKWLKPSTRMTHVFIGATDIGNNGEYKWVNGQSLKNTFSYFDWRNPNSRQLPSYSGDVLLVLNWSHAARNQFWDAHKREDKRRFPFVCEWE